MMRGRNLSVGEKGFGTVVVVAVESLAVCRKRCNRKDLVTEAHRCYLDHPSWTKCNCHRDCCDNEYAGMY